MDSGDAKMRTRGGMDKARRMEEHSSTTASGTPRSFAGLANFHPVRKVDRENFLLRGTLYLF